MKYIFIAQRSMIPLLIAFCLHLGCSNSASDLEYNLEQLRSGSTSNTATMKYINNIRRLLGSEHSLPEEEIASVLMPYYFSSDENISDCAGRTLLFMQCGAIGVAINKKLESDEIQLSWTLLILLKNNGNAQTIPILMEKWDVSLEEEIQERFIAAIASNARHDPDAALNAFRSIKNEGISSSLEQIINFRKGLIVDQLETGVYKSKRKM